MGHLYHGYVSHNQMVTITITNRPRAPRHDALQLLHLSSTHLVMDGLGRGSATTGTGTGNTVGWASEIRSSVENDGSYHYF